MTTCPGGTSSKISIILQSLWFDRIYPYNSNGAITASYVSVLNPGTFTYTSITKGGSLNVDIIFLCSQVTLSSSYELKLSFKSDLNPYYVATSSIVCQLFQNSASASPDSTLSNSIDPLTAATLSFGSNTGTGLIGGVATSIIFQMTISQLLIQANWVILISSIGADSSYPTTANLKIDGSTTVSINAPTIVSQTSISLVPTSAIAYAAGTYLTISLTNIQSSITSRTTTPITFNIYTSSSTYLVASGTTSYTLTTANSITFSISNPTSTTVGQSAVTYSFNINPPFDLGSSLYYYIAFLSEPACTASSNVLSITGSGISNFYYVTCATNCICSFTIKSGAKLTASSISVLTWTSFYNLLSERPFSVYFAVYESSSYSSSTLMAQGTGSYSGLTASTLTSVTFAHQSTTGNYNVAQILRPYVLTVTPPHNVESTVYIRMNVPTGYSLPTTASSICASCSIQTAPSAIIYAYTGTLSANTASSSMVFNIYNPACAGTYTFTVYAEARNYRSGDSTSPPGYLSSSGYSSSYSFVYIASSCSSNPTITPSGYLRYTSTSYVIDVSNCSPIPSSAYVEVIFPSGYTFSSPSCSVTCTSGSATVSCTLSSTTVTITGDLSSCTSPKLTITNVINPFLTGPVDAFQVNLKESSTCAIFTNSFTPSIIITPIAGSSSFDSFESVGYSLSSLVNMASVTGTISFTLCSSCTIVQTTGAQTYLRFQWGLSSYSCTCSISSSSGISNLNLGTTTSTSCQYYMASTNSITNGALSVNIGSCTNPISTSTTISLTVTLYQYVNSVMYNVLQGTATTQTTTPYTMSITASSNTPVYPYYQSTSSTYTLNHINTVANGVVEMTLKGLTLAPSSTGSLSVTNSNSQSYSTTSTITGPVSISSVSLTSALSIDLANWFLNMQTQAQLSSTSNYGITLNTYDSLGGALGTVLLKPTITCDFPCRQCSTSSTTCTSCYQYLYLGSYYYYYSTNNACYTDCNTGSSYYAYYPGSGTICLACLGNCLTCQSDGSTCISCKTGYYLDGTSCVNPCPSGKYNDASGICQSCTSPCATCSGTSTTCKSCITNYYYYSTTNVCVTACSDLGISYYTSGTSCFACSTTCLTCQTTSNYCLTCDTAGSYPYLVNNVCLSTCPTGYYSVIGSYTCTPCTSPCTACTSASTCTQCSAGYVVYAGSCVTSCPSSSYTVISGVCTLCNSPCLTCSGTASTCTSCSTGMYLYTGSCVSTCPSGTIVSGTNCLSCPSGCATCVASGTSTTCTKCNSPLYLSSGSCVSSCPDGTTADSSTYTCSSSSSLMSMIASGQIIPFPFFCTAIAMVFIAFIGQLRDPKTYVATNCLIQISSLLTIAFLVQAILSFGKTNGMVSLIPAAISLVAMIALDIIYGCIFRSNVVPDKGYETWSKNHSMASGVMNLFGFVFSFHCFRLLYSRYLGFEFFNCRLSKIDVYYPKLTTITLCSIFTVYLIIIIGDVIALIYVPWASQLNITIIETLVLSLVVILLSLLEFRNASLTPDELFGTKDIYDKLDEKTSERKPLTNDNLDDVQNDDEIKSSKSWTKLPRIMSDEERDDLRLTNSYPPSPRTLKKIEDYFNDNELTYRPPTPAEPFYDNVYFEENTNPQLNQESVEDECIQTIPVDLIERFKNYIQDPTKSPFSRNQLPPISEEDELSYKLQKNNKIEPLLIDSVVNPKGDTKLSEISKIPKSNEEEIRLDESENDFDKETEGKLIARNQNNKMIRHPLDPRKPRVDNPDNKIIDDNEIMGSFDLDPEDQCILIVQDANGNFIDKKGRKVNKHGYLVDDDGNILNKKGDLIYRADQIDFGEEPANPLIIQKALNGPVDKKGKGIDMMAPVSVIPNLEKDYKVKDGELDSARSDPVDPLMEDKPSNYDALNKRIDPEKYFRNTYTPNKNPNYENDPTNLSKENDKLDPENASNPFETTNPNFDSKLNSYNKKIPGSKNKNNKSSTKYNIKMNRGQVATGRNSPPVDDTPLQAAAQNLISKDSILEKMKFNSGLTKNFVSKKLINESSEPFMEEDNKNDAGLNNNNNNNNKNANPPFDNDDIVSIKSNNNRVDPDKSQTKKSFFQDKNKLEDLEKIYLQRLESSKKPSRPKNISGNKSDRSSVQGMSTPNGNLGKLMKDNYNEMIEQTKNKFFSPKDTGMKIGDIDDFGTPNSAVGNQKKY